MATDDAIIISINGTQVVINQANGRPFLDNQNRTQIPLRVISEQLGHEVIWNGDTQTVLIVGNSGDISVKIGTNIVNTPKGFIKMDTKAEIVDGRTFVPLRFICEGLGYEIEYVFEKAHKVNILGASGCQVSKGIIPAEDEGEDFFKFMSNRDTSGYLTETRAQVTIKLSSKEVDGRLHLLIENNNNTYNHRYFLVSVTKSGSSEGQYYYPDLVDSKSELDIFFGEGPGEYEIRVLVQKEGTSFWLIHQIKLTNTRDLNKYLMPESYVESNHPTIIALAKEITANQITDKDKGRAIYDWVSTNIKYDITNLKLLKAGDYTSVREINRGALGTLADRKGVCCDYVALFSALARAVGIQTRMLTKTEISNGEESNHAWSEFYCSEENRWIAVDATRKATRGIEYFDF